MDCGPNRPRSLLGVFSHEQLACKPHTNFGTLYAAYLMVSIRRNGPFDHSGSTCDVNHLKHKVPFETGLEFSPGHCCPSTELLLKMRTRP